MPSCPRRSGCCRRARSGLGHSLADAARDLLAAGYGSVCLVNSDSPTLPTAFLVDAAMALRAPDDRLVLGPAADGGYYCIGLKRPHLRLFEEIAWSTPRVFAQTCDRAREIGLAVVLLPTVVRRRRSGIAPSTCSARCSGASGAAARACHTPRPGPRRFCGASLTTAGTTGSGSPRRDAAQAAPAGERAPPDRAWCVRAGLLALTALGL